ARLPAKQGFPKENVAKGQKLMSNQSAAWASGPQSRDAGRSRRQGVRSVPEAQDGENPEISVRTMFPFTLSDLGQVRRLVGAAANAAALDDTRREDLVLAVDELATNSVCHGGGSGRLEIWRERDRLVCEVSDGGF